MRPLRNKMAKSSRHQKKQRQQQQNGSNNNKEVDSKHATTTTVTKIQNEQDQQPSSGQQDVENIEVHSIKIQRDFDKKAILPPVAVWNRLLDRSAFLISTLRVTIKRKGIFFDRELASGFYTCILNHQGYLVVYTQPLGNEGYAVNLRKASKIVFKMFNEIPIAKQRDAGQTSRLQLSKARGWYCKLSVHWHFGSMSINLPDQRMVEWCNATIFSAVDDSMLLAQVPPAGFLRSRVDAMSQIGPSLIDQKQHPQSVRTEPLMICSSNNEKQQTKSEKQSDDFKGIPLENNFLSMMDAQSVSDEPSVDNKSSVAVSDNKSSIYVMGSLDKEDSQHTLHELPEENTFEDRQIPSFLSESMQSIHESEEEIANADDKNTEEECNKQEEEVMNEEEVEVHEEDNDGGDKKEEDDSAGQASSSQLSPAQQMLFSPRRPILKRRVTFSDMKTVFKYQPTAFTEFDAPLPLPAIQKPENVDKNEKEHIVQPALDQMRIVGQHGTTISANTTATDDEEQQQQQPEPLEDSTADQRDDTTDDHNTSGDGGNISKLSASSNSNAIAIQFPSFAELFDQTRLLFETGMGADEKQEKSSSEQ